MRFIAEFTCSRFFVVIFFAFSVLCATTHSEKRFCFWGSRLQDPFCLQNLKKNEHCIHV